MDKVIEIAKDINKELLSMKEIQEYIALREEVASIKELSLLSQKIKDMKDKKSTEYHKLEKQYESYPIVKNFLAAQDEVLEILRVITKSIKI